MKIVAISDTHCRHSKLKIPECDILIHAGDATGRGRIDEVKDFAKWFEKQPARYKIFVPGNHEQIFQNVLPDSKLWFTENCPSGILLMEESVEIEGVKIFGSPWTPWFHDWAFNARPGSDIQEHWDKIPQSTDILVTHGPPHGILDLCRDGNVGCPQLLRKIEEVKPKIHIFGHIHPQHGSIHGLGIAYYNVSICNNWNMIENDPTIINY